MNVKKLKQYAPILIRISISLVFLWFGISQVINPESFFGYIPQWIYPHSVEIIHEHALQSMHNFPLTPHLIIMSNGVFEIIFGFLLLLGLFTRLDALVLSLHMILIILNIGYNDIAIRDLGLLMATISIVLYGPDKWCLDKKRKKWNKYGY